MRRPPAGNAGTIDSNPHVVWRVAIDVPADQVVTLQSLAISMDGTDDLTDVESLALFATGNQDAFSAGEPVGESSQPPKLTHGVQLLTLVLLSRELSVESPER